MCEETPKVCVNEWRAVVMKTLTIASKTIPNSPGRRKRGRGGGEGEGEGVSRRSGEKGIVYRCAQARWKDKRKGIGFAKVISVNVYDLRIGSHA